MTAKPQWRALMAFLCTMSHCSFATKADSSAPEQELTFSHVFNIDVPEASGCKLERLPSQNENGLQMESAKIGENDIIFKHNIRLRSPKCDCGESETFKSLLYRVNGLEEEVNYLKSQCAQGCCGKGGAAGVDTSCSGHGTYQQDTCSCLCYTGWEGPDCSLSSCPDECNDNGRCVDRKCVCHQGYTGDDCSVLMCPNDCNDKGRCVDGKCACFPHFTGDDCSVQKCRNDCNRNGLCFDGQCICDQGFHGEDCSLVLSPQGLRLVQATDVSLLVQWLPVSGADYYVLTYHPRGQGSALKQVRVPNMDNSYLITGLTSGLSYFVEVHAVIRGIQSGAEEIEASTGVSAVNDIQVLDRTDVSIQVDWSNPQAEVDHFRLTHTDPSGQEAEMNVQRSQEARTKHTIVGLFPGTEYLIAVQAIKGPMEGNSSSVTGSTDIDAPTNLIATQVTEDTATVSWDPVHAQIEGYMLTYTSDAGSSGEIPLGRDMTSYRLVGLKPGAVYTIDIWAFRGDKVSRKSVTMVETEMDAPTNLVAQEETESSLRVSWESVQTEIDGYKLTYRSPDGSSEEIPIGPDSTSYTINGLRPGVVYTVHIWAVRGNKASRKVSSRAETELDGPANIFTHDETESSFRVSWEGAQADIDGYVLMYVSPDGQSEEIPLGPHSSTYTINGLKPGVTYTVRIWAVKGNQASRKVSTQAATELDGPTNIFAQDETESSFRVSWEGAQAEIDGYVLMYVSPDGQSDEIPLGPHSSTYTINGLKPGVTYTVRIWAVKGNQASRKVSTQAATELDGPANIFTHDETESSFRVSWEGAQAEIDGYVLMYVSPDGQSEEIPLGPHSSTYTINGLKPGVTYTVRIWAVKGNQASRKISTQAATELDGPTNIFAHDETESSFRVSWEGAQAEIDGYVLMYVSPDGQSDEIPLGPHSSTYTINGLKPGVTYTVRIWAVKGNQASRKVSTPAATELDAPANLLAHDETESSFRVSWDGVQAEIDGYVVTYGYSEGSSGEISLGPDINSYSLTGLRPGVVYTVYIWAIKGSKASRKISAQAETELDDPANLLARDQTDTRFRVSWDGVQAEIDGYVLTHSSSEGSSGEIRLGPKSDSHSLSGLRPGVVYTVYIWAVKGDRSSRKISVQAETDIDAPKDLQALGVTTESARLTWAAPLADIEGYILTYRDEDGNLETVEKQLGARESSFIVSSLQMAKRYIVSIIAYRGSKRSKVVETIFKTDGLPYPFPVDCLQIMKNGIKKSGVYTVYINNDSSKPIDAYCDMDTDGGGWLVLQRRTTGKLDFLKRWRTYIAGFGNMTDEFWIGLDKIYQMTNTPIQYEVRFDLGLGSERTYAIYDNFKIANARQKFALTIGHYRGTAGDAMTYHQGRPWTTIDSDNDIALGNCALTHRGAWWYKNCHLANLNGKWGDNRHSMGVNWEPWKGHLVSLDFTEMKIRPVGAYSSRKRRSLMAREKSQRNAVHHQEK